MNEHRLAGCRTQPLADYLKALAVLRLVSRQEDPAAVGWWDGDALVLGTSLDEAGLVDFFCERYRPTPIVSPWNGGSGFYEGDQRDGIDAIVATEDGRFEKYAAVITAVQGWPEAPETYPTAGAIRDRLGQLVLAAGDGKGGAELEALLQRVNPVTEVFDEDPWSKSLDDLKVAAKGLKGAAKKQAAAALAALNKARTKCKQAARSAGKEQMIAVCRARLPDEAVLWIDAVCALQNLSDARYAYLLGSGGNEGRLDYSNNFMQRVTELLLDRDREQRANLLRASLFGEGTGGLTKAKIGQFHPGRAGGYNQGAELETKDFSINAWDYVLLLEGSLALASAMVRRKGATTASLSSPFTVRPSAVGYGSASSEDAAKARGEIWLPTWSRPTGYAELRHVLGEGRAALGGRQARNGQEFARAVGRLGVDRGFTGFTRFLFLKRRGDSYVAAPAGHLEVCARPAVRLLDELDRIQQDLGFFVRQFKTVPAGLASAWRNFESSVFECATSPDAGRFLSLLRSMGQLERYLAHRDRDKDPKLSRPVAGLSPRWLEAADDGGPELGIAAALASIGSTGQVGPLRANLAPVDPSAPWTWATGKGQVAWTGSSLAARLAGVLERRMLDAARLKAQGLPLWARLRVSPNHVMAFLRCQTDDALLEHLLWACTWIRFTDGDGHAPRRWRYRDPPQPLSRNWAQLKLLFDGRTIAGVAAKSLRPEPRIVPLLRSNQLGSALAVAERRLRTSGLRPVPLDPDPELDTTRLAAALLIPIHSTPQLERRALLPPPDQPLQDALAPTHDTAAEPAR